MRIVFGLILFLTLLGLLGCESSKREALSVTAPSSAERAKSMAGQAQPQVTASRTEQDRAGGGGRGRQAQANVGDTAGVSLVSIGTVYAATEAIDRKIIRNADLTLETESPTEGLRKITAAAESHGGFVVTSEFKQNPVTPGAKPSQNVTVIARVPASQFASALDQIRGAGERVISEKVSGQDVSEEYLDLEARLRTKKALEAQFLEIMKQARKVQDALDVQSQLADVRTDIERLEGRRRFLENQAALSTITTTLQMPEPIVAATTSGFSASIKRAFRDSIDTAASIILFIIQAVIVLLPIALFVGLPAWFLWRLVQRRVQMRKVEPSPIPNE